MAGDEWKQMGDTLCGMNFVKNFYKFYLLWKKI